MDNITLRKIAQDRLFNLQGNEFQSFVDRLCLKLHPNDYEPVRAGGPKGDMKNDGYCPNARIFYAAHATRSSIISDIKRKMEKDLKGCLDKHRDVRHWVFITNDDKLVGEIVHFVDSYLRPTYGTGNLETISSWGTVKIVDEMFNKLPQSVIQEILDINLNANQTQVNTNKNGVQFNSQSPATHQIATQINVSNYNDGANREKQSQGIINLLFENILRIALQNNEDIPVDDFELVEINKKIEFNFKDLIDRENILGYVLECYQYLTTVNSCYTSFEVFYQKAIKHRIKSDYDKLRREGHDNFKIFSELSESYSIQKNAEQFFLARCLVVFFFEDCTIFEKPPSQTAIQSAFKFI